MLSAISLLACQKNEKTIINGKFSSYYGMPAKIVGEDIDKDLIIKEDGTFSDTLSVPSNHYTIVAGGAIIPIYLTQGNHLTINADFSENPLKTEFIGKDAKASEYLQSKMKLNSENEATYKEMFAQKSPKILPNQYKKLKINSLNYWKITRQNLKNHL
ncbi:Thioredoxin family protein (fragment) [Capnocytophaga canimorsus]